MIFIKEVSLAYGHKKIFEEISETIGPRDRIALVGSNGSGKTTMLRMLMGEESPDSGMIEKPDYATVGYLPQDGISASGHSLREEAGKAFADVRSLREKLDEAEVKLGEMEPDTEEFYDLIDLMGAWEEQLASFEPEKMNARIEKIMMGMGFSIADMDRQLEEFSGGWQMRIALGKLLLQNPSLLILDEPTNHLDVFSALVGKLLEAPPGSDSGDFSRPGLFGVGDRAHAGVEDGSLEQLQGKLRILPQGKRRRPRGSARPP